jgi:anti-anti-sigma regulatory factor
LLQKQGKPILLDWAEANYVDASILQVLLSLRPSLAQQRPPVSVVKDNPSIREYLESSGLSSYFPTIVPVP